MDKYIDIDTLIDYLDWDNDIEKWTLRREPEDIPTADVVPVVHGEWKQSEPGYKMCSHCMADVAIYSGHKNYCPHCGAKMDGDGNG